MQTYGFKYLLITIGITAILLGCSQTDEWDERVNELSEYPESGFSISTSHSPNQVHIIELKEMSVPIIDEKDKQIEYGYASFRIYYGEYGSMLEKYEDFPGFDLTTVDQFIVHWQDDNIAFIDVYRNKEDGTRIIDETIRLDASM